MNFSLKNLTSKIREKARNAFYKINTDRVEE